MACGRILQNTVLEKEAKPLKLCMERNDCLVERLQKKQKSTMEQNGNQLNHRQQEITFIVIFLFSHRTDFMCHQNFILI